MDRRESLATAAAVAASAVVLNEAVAADRNPAAQVADKASTLKITGLRAYWVNPNVFVRIETNHGFVGWGDVKGIEWISRPGLTAFHPNEAVDSNSGVSAGRSWLSCWKTYVGQRFRRRLLMLCKT
ncbi:MAG: hypothetical protein JWO38_2311 [Gemmataceae bacterium]|nr:hypothetical protein [Gemmataceae bacterium]